MTTRIHPTIGLDTMNDVAAIVLGGGRGTRLYPLTRVRAKPAVPLCGRYRLIDIPLSNCINSGIKRIVVLTQFNHHSLNRHLHNTYRFDQFTDGFVDVLAAEQTNETGDWFQGTADAVRKQLVHVQNLRAKHYIVLSGDQLYRMDYRNLIATHLKQDADITVSALPVNREAAKSFGIMKLRKSGRIYEFVEKPKQKAVLDTLVTPDKVFEDFGYKAGHKHFLGSMGVYAFKAEVLEEIIQAHPEWIDFGKELLPGSLHSHQVYAHLFRGFWEDIGTVRAYFDVHMEMTKPDPPFEFHEEDGIIYTHARDLPGVQLDEATVSRTILCAGTMIGRAEITQSIVGIRTMVRDGVKLHRTVIQGAERYEDAEAQGSQIPMGVGENTVIEDAIIDHNARIGKNVVIRGSEDLKDYEGDQYAIRDGIVVVYKYGVIPDGMVIGKA
ncbi:MAG: glucose-1-phosphate adenylyltransferase [Candidatus Hydrogenedentota bacterium]